VDASQRGAKPLDLLNRHITVVQQPAQLSGAVELAHLDRELDRRAHAIHLQFCTVLHHCTDLQIERRGKAPVEAQLFAAEPLAALQGREIEERKSDRPLDLVRELACQDYPGDRGLHYPDIPDRMRVRGRVQQAGQLLPKTRTDALT
jgi:hypothetical protein